VERRLLTFIVASTAFFLVYAWLRVMFAPPLIPPEANQPQPGADAVEAPADELRAERADTPSESDPVDEALPERPAIPKWSTLGSMAPDSGYQMLVTLCSRGGGIERIELTERDDDGEFKYRRIDVFSGYLGYFAPRPDDLVTGLRVNVVGPGTPADLAGLQVGDVIVKLDDQAIETPDDLDAALQQSKPGDEVSIELLRGDAPTPLTLQATLSEHPLDLVRLAAAAGVDQVGGNLTRLSCLLNLGQVNRKGILTDEQSIAGLPDPTDLVWNAEPELADASESIGYSIDLSDAEMQSIGGHPVRLSRSYTLRPGSYSIDMSVALENLSEQPQQLAYRLEGPNGVTLEGWWYSTKISPNMWGGAAARDVIYKTAADGHQLVSGFKLLERAREEPKDPSMTLFAPDGSDAARNTKYVAVDAQYFVVGYVPDAEAQSMTRFRRAAAVAAAVPEEIPRHKERAVNSTFYLDSIVQEVPPGGELRQELQLFAGPKQPDLLAKYELGDAIYYGWFSGFAKALAWLLHMLSAIGNYALAIILLTVIVRASMFPLSRKAAINAQKMQELAPEMKKINEQYKDDMEGKLKAQRELQQRVGFNPLAGCLPMFLQLPIFIGLYRALSVDIELRQAALSKATDWASNLAAPDMLYYWGDWLWDYLSGRGTGWLGPYFNILPVIVVILFLLQQKLFMPPATDDQTRLTQKMMNIMMLMMGVFFFRVPAGLCIYFISSSLWGICERLLVKKTLPEGQHFDPALLDGSAATASSGKPEQKSQTLADKIRSQVAKPEPPVVPPHKRKRPKSKKR